MTVQASSLDVENTTIFHRRSFAWPRKSAVLALGALLGLSAVGLGLLLIVRSLESSS